MKLRSSYTKALRSTALTVALAPMFAIMLAPACLADHAPENVGPHGNQVPYSDHDATPTDYNNPKQYPEGTGARHSQPGVPYWHVTVCMNSEVSLFNKPFKPFGDNTKPFTPNGKDAPVGSTGTEGGPPEKPAASGHHATISVNSDGNIAIKGGSNGGTTPGGQDIPGTTDWDVNDKGSGQHFKIFIRVVDCSKYHLHTGDPPRGLTSSALLGSSLMNSFIPGSSGDIDYYDGGSEDGARLPPTGNLPHDDTTDDSTQPKSTTDTISDTTEAIAGHPGYFGGSANVTAPEKQYPLETK